MGELFARRRPPLVYLIKSAQDKDIPEGGLMDYSIIAGKLRERIAGFSGELSRGLPKVARRFTGEMLYGIQAGQSVVLDRGAKLR